MTGKKDAGGGTLGTLRRIEIFKAKATFQKICLPDPTIRSLEKSGLCASENGMNDGVIV